jgi:hypothetical protein
MRRGAEQQELQDFVDALREVLGLNPITWNQAQALKGNQRARKK